MVDDSDLLEFKAAVRQRHGLRAGRIEGHRWASSPTTARSTWPAPTRPRTSSSLLCQLGHPIIYLQNTTGYMVGKDSEQGGMIKHGSKMIQAVTNATVPQITIQCGASFGAGNYGMCGRGYAPRFLFSWPSAKHGGDGRRAGRPHHADRDRGGAGAQRHHARPGRVPKPSSTRSSRVRVARPTRSTPAAWCWTTA
jgi:hypothetical protein